MKDDKSTFEVDGKVISAQRDAIFKVELVDGGRILDCHVSGKIRKHFIKILPGDIVTVVISKYDLTKGRIIYRKKG